MSAPAAISGTFADFRTVKGRKVAQLVIEVAIEHADDALRALGGVPRPDDPKWVAIARLDQTKAVPERPSARKAWADLPPSQQAAIRCTELDFKRFIHGKWDHNLVATDEDAAQAVRDLCRVSSRKDLDANHKARVLWHQLDREFLQATGRLAHG